jgi:hypothetical protein
MTDSKDNEANSNDPPQDGGTHSSFEMSQQKIEDFDDGANVLWSLYVRETKGHDEATIRT